MSGVIYSLHSSEEDLGSYSWVSLPAASGARIVLDEDLLAGEFIPCYEHILQVGTDPKVHASTAKKVTGLNRPGNYVLVVDARWTYENVGRLSDNIRSIREAIPSHMKLGIRYADDVDLSVVFTTYYLIEVLYVGPGWDLHAENLMYLVPVVLRDGEEDTEDVQINPFWEEIPILLSDEKNNKYRFESFDLSDKALTLTYERVEDESSLGK